MQFHRVDLITQVISDENLYIFNNYVRDKIEKLLKIITFFHSSYFF